MTKIKIEDASLDQMRQFATEVLGMDVAPQTNSPTLRAKIAQAWDGDHIEVDGEVGPSGRLVKPAAPATKPTGHQITAVSAKGDPVVMLVISEQPGKGGDRPVPVGVNGVAILIPRGAPQPVPWRYYQALCSAVQTVYEQLDDMTIIAKQVPCYPVTVTQMPPQDQIDRWNAVMGGG